MKALFALFGFSLALAVSSLASAQTDFTTASKVACTPNSVTRCREGNCTTQQATEQQKGEVLLLDFAAKKGASRRGGETRDIGSITGDSVTGGVRRIVLTVGPSQNINMSLTKDGKLTVEVGNGDKAEATCSAGS